MIAKKIRKEALRYKVDADDLADAVSALQYQELGMEWNAKEYKDKIKDESIELWAAAKRCVDFIKRQEKKDGINRY